MQTIYLFPAGSHGDVHPYLGLACELQRRGIQATLVTSGLYHDLAERCGVPFVEISNREQDRRLLDDPDIWHPLRSGRALAKHLVVRLMREQFEAIARLKLGPESVLVGSALGFGVRLAHEVFGLPYLSLHLQPAILWSQHQSPLLSRRTLLGDRVPRWLKQLQYRVGFWLMFDRHLRTEVNAYRRELNLAPVKSCAEMFHSPLGICAMFPEWFAARQPDWPQPLTFCGFPLWDERGITPLPEDLENYLHGGTPPVVFTPGTGHTHAQKFWRAAVDACRRLKIRGMLLTRFPDQLPGELPEGVRHFDYVPFSQLLPRAAAVVHHGGIGTLSQALAAGTPQLITPLAYDQPDNAARVQRLGVGDLLWPNHFTGPRLASKLQRLLNDPTVTSACQKQRAAMQSNNGIAKACDAIQDFGKQSP
ncbi:MAG: glycosyltransferase [Pirellulaceae bacterium]|nr:glycosyltransferase [Pirellulaceae bacterium]